MAAGKKIIWSKEMIDMIKANFYTMTNRELADSLHLKLTAVRTKCYELGFKRMEMEYWTDEQIQFLKDNYKSIGDLELSEIFATKWHKNKGWSLKHIEKKRKYLQLKRTAEDLANITQRGIDNGRLNQFGAGDTKWLTTGPAKEGEIRFSVTKNGIIQSRIKVGKKWDFWPRVTWKKLYGDVPEGYVIVMKDGDVYNTDPENMEIVTKSECTRRNVTAASINLSDNYIAGMLAYGHPELKPLFLSQPALINLKRKQLLLKRRINEHAKHKQKA